METLIVSLILMFVSGITFVAYKHPEFYASSFTNKLYGISILVVICTQVYTSSNKLAFSKATLFIPPEKLNLATATNESLSLPTYVYVGAIALLAYSFFLSWLALHMQHTVKKDNEKH